MNSMLYILAQQAQPDGPGIAPTLMMFGVIFFIFYFLVMRPQAKEAEKHRQFLGALKVGDEVVTDGGIYGRVAGIEDGAVQLDVSRGTKIRVLKAKVRMAQPEAAAASSDKDEAKEKEKEDSGEKNDKKEKKSKKDKDKSKEDEKSKKW
ncbi:MAG: preprotein translocase subunit YajC [Bradymonadaceae bacterium]